MGQNQSSETPREKSHSRSRGGTPHSERHADRAERDRRLGRRSSIHPLFGPSQPADASATTVAVQGTTTHNLDTANLEKMLQSTSPELSIKSGKSATSSSRRKKDAESLQTEISPDTAAVQSIDIPAAATAPIALPTRSRQEELQDDGPSAQLSTTYEDHTYIPIHNSAYHRPPRMPLPIAEMPDSPSLGPETISKTDSDVPIFTHDVGDSVLPRRNSIVSMDTQDEDDVGEELQPFGAQYTSETIPYTIYWRQPAKQVFVTGTFVAWDRKLRMKQR